MQIAEKRRAQLVAGPYTRLLAEHEKAMSALYDTFANTLPAAESFWRTIAREELIHRNLILKIDENLQSGAWKFKRPNFVTTNIIDSLEWIASRKLNVEQKGVSMREALKIALDIETRMIESTFFNVIDADNSEMIEVIETQSAYTRAHIRRLQKEARRLKWRIFGNKKGLPKGAKKALTHTELKSSIKASQANMLGMLIEMEESAGKLYNIYSETLPDMADFWSKLGAEELQHATLLRTLYKLLDNGNVFHNVDHFNKKDLEEMIEFIINTQFDVQHKKPLPQEALSVALKMEHSIVEGNFYAIVTSDAPEFQIMAKHLVSLTREHTGKIESEISRIAHAEK